MAVGQQATWPVKGPVTVYSSAAAFPTVAPQGYLAVAADTGQVYEFFNGAWVIIAGPNDMPVPGGPQGSVQFNNAGTFAGFGNWDGTTTLTVPTLSATVFTAPYGDINFTSPSSNINFNGANAYNASQFQATSSVTTPIVTTSTGDLTLESDSGNVNVSNVLVLDPSSGLPSGAILIGNQSSGLSSILQYGGLEVFGSGTNLAVFSAAENGANRATMFSPPSGQALSIFQTGYLSFAQTSSYDSPTPAAFYVDGSGSGGAGFFSDAAHISNSGDVVGSTIQGISTVYVGQNPSGTSMFIDGSNNLVVGASAGVDFSGSAGNINIGTTNVLTLNGGAGNGGQNIQMDGGGLVNCGDIVLTSASGKIVSNGSYAMALQDAAGLNDINIGAGGQISFFDGTAVVGQQTGGVATAGAVYTANEQGMINRMYSALRAYGLLT